MPGVLIVALLLAFPFQESDPGLVGSLFEHTVRPGETLFSLGARYGADWRVIASENDMDDPDVLRAGRTLRIDNRHIVPAAPFDTGIVINIPQRMLFYFDEGMLSGAFPVDVGRADWPTPIGEFYVEEREEDPIWEVPESIQEEMRRAHRPVVTRVPPGPDNPLGHFWVGLSAPGLGIHGTNAPSSIYGFTTHGCIRLHPDDIRSLYPLAVPGTPVHIIYDPVLVTVLENGRIFLEVNRDVYGLTGGRLGAAERARALLAGLGAEVEESTLRTVLDQQAGVARALD